METRDIVIVGSGPAGSATALALRQVAPQLAARTLILERARHPREKICAGGLSHRALEILRALEVDLPAARDNVQVTWVDGARFVYKGFEIVARSAGKPAAVVRRNEFDALLARTAHARGGGELCEGEALVDLRRVRDGWVLATERREVHARVVVGADGAGSVVRRRAGFSRGRPATRLVVIETPVDAASTPEFTNGYITIDFSVVPEGMQGYYWDFPCLIEGRPHLSRGIFDRNPEPRRRVDLLAALRRCTEARGGRWAAGATPREMRVKWFPEREFAPFAPVSQPGLILVGEAAGIDPLVGEGIAQALEYGVLAAGALSDAFARGDCSMRSWKRRILRSRLGKTLLLYRLVADQVYGPRSEFWLRFLGTRPGARAALTESFHGGGRLMRHGGRLARELLAHTIFGADRPPSAA